MAEGRTLMGTWGTAWSDAGFRRATWVGLAMALPAAVLLPAFFTIIGAKPGFTPFDPVLASIPARNVAVQIFVVLYVSVVWGIAALLPVPRAFIRMLHAYAALLVLRMLSMYLVTFEPPPGIIPLVDPVTKLFYPGDTPFLKDLFFSGHTATPLLFAFAAGAGGGRMLLAACAAVVGVLVIVQHVHYSVDVLAAPLFAWLAWRVSAATMRLCGAVA
jgi:hypothetical protein